jgi:hypothetical protein
MPEKKPMGRSKDEESLAATAPSHDDIARLAYALWEARRYGDGSAEQDWLEAERQLQQPLAKSEAA